MSQCVTDDLCKKSIAFNYVSDSVVFHDCHYLRNNCTCRSGSAHSFGHIVLGMKGYSSSFFPTARVKALAIFCSLWSRRACTECFDFSNLYYLRDPIKICVSSLVVFRTYSLHVKLFNYIERHNFFQNSRKIKQDRNEQMDQWWNQWH